jgi:solute:Na+ symporter, SSS family
VPDFLEYRFDRRVRTYFSLLTIFANIIVDTAGAIVPGTFIPGLDIVTAAFILVAIAGIYTAADGLAAVVYTDVLQALNLLTGSAIVAVLAFARLDFPRVRLVAEAPQQYLSLMQPLGGLGVTGVSAGANAALATLLADMPFRQPVSPPR